MKVNAQKLLEFVKSDFAELQIPASAQLYVRDQMATADVDIMGRADRYTRFAVRGKVYQEEFMCNICTIRRGKTTKIPPSLDAAWVKFLAPYMSNEEKSYMLQILNKQLEIAKSRCQCLGYDDKQTRQDAQVVELNTLINCITNTRAIKTSKGMK